MAAGMSSLLGNFHQVTFAGTVIGIGPKAEPIGTVILCPRSMNLRDPSLFIQGNILLAKKFPQSFDFVVRKTLPQDTTFT